MFVDDFALNVLITCLDETFIKTYIYTCTTDEPQMVIVCLSFIAHVYSFDVFV